jgi:hypothetical protein
LLAVPFVLTAAGAEFQQHQVGELHHSKRSVADAYGACERVLLPVVAADHDVDDPFGAIADAHDADQGVVVVSASDID